MIAVFGNSERKLLTARLASVRPGSVRAVEAKRTRRLRLKPLVARVLDPVLGIDRKIASDEPMSLLVPVAAGAIAAAASFVVLAHLLGVGLGITIPVALACATAAARLTVKGKRDTIRRRMEDEFGMALGVIIRCVRAGLPVNEGMRAVAAEVRAPTGPEFRRCVDQIQLGNSFEGSLASMAARCALPDYRFFAVTVTLQRQTGGNLAETLDNLAETMRKRKGVRLKAQALTSETRATVLVLALLPFAVGGILMVVSPAYVMQLFETEGGRMLLGVAILVQAFGLFVIRTMSQQSLG